MTLASDPAYPFVPNPQMQLADGTWDQNTEFGDPGFAKLHRACIDLLIPATGDAELDALIAQARRREMAKEAMLGFLSADRHDEFSIGGCSKDAVATADALLRELAKEST